MKSKKLIPTDRPSVNAIPVYQEQYNKLWYDLFEGGGALEATSMTLSGDLTVSGTTTLNGNLVLGDAATDSLTINAEATYSDIINYSNATGITAGATQTMAGATALTEEINNVTTCTTANDGVALPTAIAGRHIYVKNSGATNLRVWTGNASDTIDAQSVTALGRYVIITPGASLDFYAKDATTWETNKDASLSLSAPTTAKGALQILSADSAGDTITTITNASQAAARTYTIPDAGAAASFVMTEGAQTINGAKTLGSVLLAPNGTALLPTYSFTNDPNSGMFSSGANALGFATDGTEQWVINSSGALNPFSDNAHDIGNGTVNARDIYITRGLKGVSANFGTRGVADATLTMEHFTTGKDVVTVLTLTDYIIGPLAGAAAAKVLVPANAIFTFPAGAHALYLTSYSLALTATGTAVTPDVSIASAAGDGSANATMNLSAGNGEDIVTGTAIADTVTHAVVSVGPVGVVAGVLTGIGLNAIGGVKTVYLNAAATWNADNTGNLTATGTITFKWTIM